LSANVLVHDYADFHRGRVSRPKYQFQRNSDHRDSVIPQILREGDLSVTEKRLFRPLYIGWLLAIVMLALAITGRHTREFYVILRLICSAVFTYSAVAFVWSAVDCYRSCKQESGTALVVAFHLLIAGTFATLAVLFNPVAEFHYARATWLTIDKVVFGFVLVLCCLSFPKLGFSRVAIDWKKYSAPDELRVIWNDYSDRWPDNNERYAQWKPASILPAPKWAVMRAIKLAYAEWPRPIDWTVFEGFFMEFVDLALHLPQEKYELIERFRKRRVLCCGREDTHDPLFGYMLSIPSSLYSIEKCYQDIIKIRDGMRRSAAWDPVDADDSELDAVRQILLESAVDFASFIQEWRHYILSIGRDRYLPN